MKYVVFCSFALLVSQIALAQSLPVPEIGSCPTYTFSSGGSCFPVGNHQVYLNPSGQPCGQGWIRSGNGNYCVK